MDLEVTFMTDYFLAGLTESEQLLLNFYLIFQRYASISGPSMKCEVPGPKSKSLYKELR
jgi:hypothetical protein